MKTTHLAVLDDKDAILALDPQCSFKDELEFAQNMKKAVKNIKNFKMPNKVEVGRSVIDYSRNVNKVVFAGMGGSAIAGDLTRDWLNADVTVPMESVRGYHLPRYADDETLTFLISFSGSTEETLSCMLDALNKGCVIVSISSDGALARVNKALGLPVIGLPKMAAARVSFPYLFAPIPYVLARFKILPYDKVNKEVAAATRMVERLTKEYTIESRIERNSAKKAALQIFGTIPVIYAHGPYRSVGLRFKTQVNENCKLPARCDVFPELNHNEIMSWEASSKILKHYTLVLLRSEDEPKEVSTRIETLKARFFEKRAKSVLEIWAQGENLLTRMFYLLFTADMISLYLSVLHRRDPIASETFKILKYEVTERLRTLDRLEQRILKFVGG
ncbi:MAG TPA: bifunctional phosphoglucose/phosphomannose isomerase [Candidatus Bathyarchaeia archaeon]|nr:bifunctional phosphoglucose/phosphomannose isomerase [Candidatus Bathyarchaeia archaeon]